MRLDNLAAEIQANARAPSTVRVTPTMLFNAKELLEHSLAKLRRNAGAGVRHGNVQEALSLRCCILPGRPRIPIGPPRGVYLNVLFS